MESKHMSQQVFAQFIDMSPASLSSVFNGRTKPTLNIVEAIKKKIPDINTNWLLFGLGEMFESSSAGLESADDVVTEMRTEPTLNFDSDNAAPLSNDIAASHNYNGVRNTRPEVIREEIKYIDRPQRKVMEIRVYYDDLTFETFVPEKK